MMTPMFRQVIALLSVLTLAGAAADARSRRHHRNSNSGNAPGVFDYYLLSLSWAPDFCDTHPAKMNGRECGRGNHVAFIVHGLWPQFANGTWPKECAPDRPVAADIVTRMLPLMTDAGLIQHEWKEHGTCSGLSAAAYFDTVRQAFAAVRVPGDYTNLTRPIQVDPAGVDAKFAGANPSLPPGSIHTACDAGEVSEVHICFSRNLQPQACNAERDCSSANLKMLPPR